MTIILYKRTRTGTRRPLRSIAPPRSWLEYVTFETATASASSFDGVLQ